MNIKQSQWKDLFSELPQKAWEISGSILGEMLSIGMIGGYCEEGFPLYYVSKELYLMLGYETYEEFYTAIQGKVANTIYYEDRNRVKQDADTQYYAGMKYTSTYRMQKKDGSLFWVLDKGCVAETDDGRLAVLSCRMDITMIMDRQTELHKNLEELEKQNRELKFLNNTIPVGYHRCADTPDYDYLFISNKLLNMLGYTRQEIKDLFDDKFKNMIHPDDWQRVFGGEQNILNARNTNLKFEYRMKCKNGYIWVEDHSDYVTDLETPFFQGTVMDITERVVLREQLSASVKAFRIAAKEAGNMVFTYNRREKAIYCDEWVAREFGVQEYQPGIPYDILERGDIVAKESEEEYKRIHEEIIKGAKEAGGIISLINAEGSENVYELKLQTIFNDNGMPTELAVGVYKDITEQYYLARSHENSLKTLREEYNTTKKQLYAESQEQLDMIYALSRDYYALWRVDLKNNLIHLRRNENRRATVLTDKDQQIPDSYSNSLKTFGEKWVHPDDRKTLYEEAGLERIRERLKTEEAYSLRIRRKEPKATEYSYVEWRIVRLVNTEDTWTALIAVRDIDGEVLREAQQQDLLKNALNQAERASRAKTTFLSNMSHDIRTPMNAIIGFAGIAAEHIDSKDRVRDCLSKIMSSSNHLLSLINDILDMSRIESGKMTLQEKECSLSETIHNLVHMIRPQMKAKQLEFFADTIDIRDEYLIFDHLKLDQILINILGNAAKFTPSGGSVFFTIRQSESDKPGCAHYEFIVKDTGIGMSEEFLKRIFEPFERESTVSASGTGLGMAITKNTVDIMGGTIKIESEPGKGSTFTVEFDFKRQDVSHMQESIDEFKGMRTLVADGDFKICAGVTKMLGNIGICSECAASGREAVYRARKAHNDNNPFNCYIIDLMLPEMDGIETVRRIRRDIGDNSSIIILTAYDRADIEEEARAAGVTAFCSKPLFMSDIRRALSEANGITEKNLNDACKEKPDFSGKRVLIVEDNELNREIVTDIMENYGFEVECVSDGSAAVQTVCDSEENRFDLILMDVQMPIMDGYEATRAIRELPRRDIPNIPIIAMTANAFEEDKKRALESGMNEHISKPISIDEILATLSRFLPANNHK